MIARPANLRDPHRRSLHTHQGVGVLRGWIPQGPPTATTRQRYAWLPVLKRIIRIFEYSNSYVRIVLFVFVFVSNFRCLSIRYSIRLLGKFLTNWLTQTLKFRRVPPSYIARVSTKNLNIRIMKSK